jgi:hypothetical protein
MPKKVPPKVKLIQEAKGRRLKEDEKNISFSQFYMYSQCPHKWYLTYVRNLSPYQPSIYTTFGTALHETAQEWLEVMYSESAKAADEIDLHALLRERMIKTYKKEKYRNGHEHFSDGKELDSFLEDGIQILDYLKKKRNVYFPIKGTYLAGIETPILYPIQENLYFKGFIDLVFYNKNTDRFRIVDIKTSTSGWKDYAKKDTDKISQVLLYKEYFAKQFDTDIDKIDVEYFIVKRKVPKDPDFPAMGRRVQEFKPSAGKINRGRALKKIGEFVKEGFDSTGQFVDKVYQKKPSKNNCRFCVFKDNPLCNPSF